MSVDLKACFEAASKVAKEAGKMITEAYSLQKRVETKSSPADLVTESDAAVEKLIIQTLSSAFPTHCFIGEESVAAGDKCCLTDSPTWIIDPIDGTTNFIHTFPFTCVSIGFAVNKEIEIGIVYNPVLDECYTAQRGAGAFLNGAPIHVSSCGVISDALVVQEFGSSKNANELESKMRGMSQVIQKAHGIRSMGSAALALCAVAAGRVDGYFEYGFHIWDFAAGVLIVAEAGGHVQDTTGGKLDLLSRRVLCASTQALADQLAACVVHIEMDSD